MKTIKNQLNERLFKGFRPWDSAGVLSHILMPYGFALRLGFKDYASVSNNVSVLRNAMFGEAHDDGREILTPGMCSHDGAYTELTVNFTGISAKVSTAADGENICILVQPLKKNPCPVSVFVEGGMLWNRKGHVSRTKNGIEAVFGDKKINVYAVGEELPDYYLGISSPYINLSLKEKVMFSTRKLSLREGEKILDAAREKVNVAAKKYGTLADCYKGMLSVISWETVYDPSRDRIFSTVSRMWSRPAGGYVMFGWDMLFTALMFAKIDKDYAYVNAFAILGEATERGFIPNFSCGNLYKSYDHSQPPVGSMVVRRIYEKYKEKWFLEETFDGLYRWNTWYHENRTSKSGAMCWGTDDVWPNELSYFTPSKSDRQGAAYESGLDNSPMYDDVPFDKETNMLCLEDVGLTSLFIYDCENLSFLAAVLGRKKEMRVLESRKKDAEKGLQALWNEEAGIFLNRRTDTDEFSDCITPVHFYSLFAELKEGQAEKILRHFYDEKEFFGEYMLPSVAKNHPSCVEQDYWRGSIWPPMNYLVYRALKKQGADEAAEILAEKSRALFEKEWKKYGHVHENYNYRTGMGCGAPKNNSEKFYNWGGLLALVAIEENLE